MNKKINGGLSIILLLALLALFSFYGCGTTPGIPVNTWAGMPIEGLSQTQLQQMLSDSINNYKTINIYKYDMFTTISTNVTGGSNPWATTMNTIMGGATDVESDQTQLNLNMSVLFTGMGAIGEQQTLIYDIYAIDSWIYMNMSMTGMGSQWVKISMSDFMRQTLNLNSVDRQMKPLEAPNKVEYLRTESFNGVNCYVMSVSPSPDNLGDWLNDQDTSSSSFNWKDVVGNADVFSNFSLLCYLSTDTNQIMGMSMNMETNLSPDAAGLPDSNFTNMMMSINMNMLLFDINVPYSLTLPAEASSAHEVSEDVFSN